MGEASFHRVAPVFVTSDLQRALEHYARLGFRVWRHEDDGYGFVRRGTVEIHLAEIDQGEPSTNTSCAYIWVDDADALHAEWSQSGAEGRFHPPTDTDYELREGAHVDEDGNLLRFGSPLRSSRGSPVSRDAPIPERADEPATCGEGLAAQAAIPQKVAAYLQALGDTLEAHLPTIDASDAPGRAERDAYRELIAAYASLASDLGATAEMMRGYRALPPAHHHAAALADPARLAPFARFVRLEEELAEMLAVAAERDRELLPAEDASDLT